MTVKFTEADVPDPEPQVPEVTEVLLIGDQVRFQVTSATGFNYQIERFRDGVWTAEGPMVAGTGSELEFMVTRTPMTGSELFRVRATAAP